jgi:hypothetical protein
MGQDEHPRASKNRRFRAKGAPKDLAAYAVTPVSA